MGKKWHVADDNSSCVALYRRRVLLKPAQKGGKGASEAQCSREEEKAIFENNCFGVCVIDLEPTGTKASEGDMCACVHACEPRSVKNRGVSFDKWGKSRKGDLP